MNLVSVRMGSKKLTEEQRIRRFWDKVEKSDDCWIWTGSKTGGNGKQYGAFWNGEKQVYAHRFSYLITNGAIQDGMQIDHLCRNPACVRPDHLEVVDSRTNTIRGVSIVAQNAAKTHCSKGHELPVDRKCRICGRARWRAYYRRRRLREPGWR